ncbi:Long-chain-fatty-acid--CoA ligase 4 [Tritrichomonas musculus]|uniref:Long-chain-fatty-acid--CoA ligase 4 n=1 Tax=Tritrichomonas musculus TaxID=1915356 RepID=A0ABR2HJV6_9EUKA
MSIYCYNMFKCILKKGIDSRAQNHFSGSDEVAVIVYTSGSTGTPKGCSYSILYCCKFNRSWSCQHE